jgi:hypothetical protein
MNQKQVRKNQQQLYDMAVHYARQFDRPVRAEGYLEHIVISGFVSSPILRRWGEEFDMFLSEEGLVLL